MRIICFNALRLSLGDDGRRGLLRQRSNQLSGVARPPAARCDESAGRHDGARFEDHSVLDDGALIDNTPFSDIDRVLDHTRFQARTGPNRSVVSHRYRGGEARVKGRDRLDDDAVLDVHYGTNGHVGVVPPHNGAVPNTGFISQLDAADDGRVGGHKRIVRGYRSSVPIFHHRAVARDGAAAEAPPRRCRRARDEAPRRRGHRGR
mmetsp:Transcript_21343/g.63756  ORF Transcript_21343/g.63756 Transcript_21343/m.63756 type:complete len:205 (+) Transcript_21343:78-692(+)